MKENKKEEALNKIKDLESEIEKLKIIINQPEDLFSKIKNYSDVCKELKEDEIKESDFKFLHKNDRKKAINFAKVKQIERLFNGDWEVKFDSNQQNWFPYFTSGGSSGLVFLSSGCYDDCSYFEVGFFKDKKTSDFVGKTFIDIYRELY